MRITPFPATAAIVLLPWMDMTPHIPTSPESAVSSIQFNHAR